MAKKKEVEKQLSIVSRIDLIVEDIRKQADEEVNQLQAVRKVELSKVVLTFGEVEEAYTSLVEDRKFDSNRCFGVRLLRNKIKQMAEAKI